MSRVLTIETGLRCNNRCIMCPQTRVRMAGPRGSDPSTEDLRIRIREGREAGFDALGLSGGEPTLRPDLPDLIRFARGIGFDRVSVTTNGRMASSPGYAHRLVAAGLTGASVSIHGPDGRVHDAVVGVEGAFVQTVAGAEALLEAASREGVRFDASTITILVPGTLPRLRETLSLAGRLGFGLHILQPFILARENLEDGGMLLIPLDDLVAGIERALRGGLPHGGRVKPFNLPPCRLESLGPLVEFQDYAVKTVREREASLPAGAAIATQAWRTSACTGCLRTCPGVRIEHVPEAEAVDAILADVDAHVRARPVGDAWLTCLDLLGPDGLERVLSGARRVVRGGFRVAWAGFARTQADDFLRICAGTGVDEVIALVRPGERRTTGGGHLSGNVERIVSGLGLLRSYPGLAPALFLVPEHLGSPDHDLDLERVDRLLSALEAAGGKRLYLQDPGAAGWAAPRNAIAAIRERWREGGREIRRVPAAPGDPGWTRGGDTIIEDLAAMQIPHRFSGRSFGWVMWSNPVWLSGEGKR